MALYLMKVLHGRAVKLTSQAKLPLLLPVTMYITSSSVPEILIGMQQMRDTFFLGRRGYSRAKTEAFGVHLGMGIGLVGALT